MLTCTCGCAPGSMPGGRRSAILSRSVRYTIDRRGQPAISPGLMVGVMRSAWHAVAGLASVRLQHLDGDVTRTRLATQEARQRLGHLGGTRLGQVGNRAFEVLVDRLLEQPEPACEVRVGE